MSGYLTSRLCAVALMIALLAKPCLGLIDDWQGRPDMPQLATLAASQQIDSESESCSRPCLSARLEDAQYVFNNSAAKKPAMPVSAVRLNNRLPEPKGRVSMLQPADPVDVRTRLAMLGRLLL